MLQRTDELADNVTRRGLSLPQTEHFIFNQQRTEWTGIGHRMWGSYSLREAVIEMLSHLEIRTHRAIKAYKEREKRIVCRYSNSISFNTLCTGVLCDNTAWGRAPPPAFHTLAEDTPLNRGATHFTLGLRPCTISSFLLQIYLPPLPS